MVATLSKTYMLGVCTYSDLALNIICQGVNPPTFNSRAYDNINRTNLRIASKSMTTNLASFILSFHCSSSHKPDPTNPSTDRLQYHWVWLARLLPQCILHLPIPAMVAVCSYWPSILYIQESSNSMLAPRATSWSNMPGIKHIAT